MAKYDQQTAVQLAEELLETAQAIVERLKQGTQPGPLLDQTCERLGRALGELKTTLR